jgi:carboxypeptidase C (cathepsin A)
LVWAGDTDWICNWMGNLASANGVKYPGQAKFAAAPLKPYTVKGKKVGEFKNVDNLSFLNVNNAGHEAAFYVGSALSHPFIYATELAFPEL